MIEKVEKKNIRKRENKKRREFSEEQVRPVRLERRMLNDDSKIDASEVTSEVTEPLEFSDKVVGRAKLRKKRLRQANRKKSP